MSGAESKTVWLVNKGGHDYTKLDKYGKVLPLTSGNVNALNLDRLMLMVAPKLQLTSPNDYLAVSGLPLLNGLIMVMWLEKYDHINLLQWSMRREEYVFIHLSKAAIRQNIVRVDAVED